MMMQRQQRGFSARLTSGLLAGLLVTSFTACTSKFGDRKLNSRYVYAQSTVTPLRNVSASGTTRGFGIACGFTREEFERVYDEALAQDPTANILLDYFVTYETMILPFYCTSELTISGLAAMAEVR
jgi:hypothetical protein